MDRFHQQHHLRAWDISSLIYEKTYIKPAHQTDEDTLNYIGSSIVGAIVADCGCGPGIVTEKFLNSGAAKVVAIDSNARMIRKLRSRLNQSFLEGRLFSHQCNYENLLNLQKQIGINHFDLVLFKRSLYMSRTAASAILRNVYKTLSDRGVIIIVHPERKLSRYAFAPPTGLTPYTAFHLFNRAISHVAVLLGIQQYALYTKAELMGLAQETLPSATVINVPTQQRPYNIVAIHRNTKEHSN